VLDPTAPDRARASAFFRYDGPTWLVALVLYGAWAAVIWFHRELTWWIVTPVGAYLVAWHFSLQHEAIHSFRSAPQWLRWAVVFPPLGLWLPFPLYYAAHRKHHQNTHLTEPGVDTESVYVRQADWAAMPAWKRAVLVGNQTLIGRVTIGPTLRLVRLAIREAKMVANGNFAHVPHWVVHALLVALLFVYISGVAGMPWWQYVVGIALPAFGLGWVRSFIEHRYGSPAPDAPQPPAHIPPGHRTAAVEASWPWGLLFLYNNLHIVHHLYPQMPWWEIPRYWRAHRAQLAAHNGHYVFAGGYLEIARRWLIRPVFIPRHPRF
jgi:fatty acid desaturase